MTKTKEDLPAALSFVDKVVEGKLESEFSKDKTELTNFKRGFRFSRKWKTDNKRPNTPF